MPSLIRCDCGFEASGDTDEEFVRRLQLVREGQPVLADQVPTLPLAPVLDVVVYNSVKVGGPVKAPPPGAFTNLNEWFCRTC